MFLHMEKNAKMQKKDARQRQQFEDRVPSFLDCHQKCTRCCNSRSSAWVRSDIPASKGINLFPDTSRARDVCATQLRLLGQRSGTDSHNRNVLPSALANIHCSCYSWIFSIYFKASVKLLYEEITNLCTVWIYIPGNSQVQTIFA